MTDVVNKVSKLSTVNESTLNKLLKLSIFVINDSVIESKMKNEPIVEFELGIGKLILNIDNENVQYKFIPNMSLELAVQEAVVNEKNTLQDLLEKAIIDKVTCAYKDLF